MGKNGVVSDPVFTCSLDGVNIKLKKVKFKYTGEKIMPDYTAVFKGENITNILGDIYQVKGGGKNPGNHTVIIKSSENGAAGSRTLKFKIEKAKVKVRGKNKIGFSVKSQGTIPEMTLNGKQVKVKYSMNKNAKKYIKISRSGVVKCKRAGKYKVTVIPTNKYLLGKTTLNITVYPSIDVPSAHCMAVGGPINGYSIIMDYKKEVPSGKK